MKVVRMWRHFKRPFTYERTSVAPHGKALFIESQFIAHWDFSVKHHITIKLRLSKISKDVYGVPLETV